MITMHDLKSLFSFAALSLIFTTQAIAEVHNCNGVWTNVPCNHLENNKLVPSEKAETKQLSQEDKKTESSKVLSQKKTLLHDLTMKSINASRNYNEKFDVSPVSEFCLKKPSSLDECKARVDTLSEKIDSKVATLDTLKNQQIANKLLEERNKLEADQKTVNVLQQNNTVIYVPPRRHPRDKFDVLRDPIATPPGNYIPGNNIPGSPNHRHDQHNHDEQVKRPQTAQEKPVVVPPEPKRGVAASLKGGR